MSHPLFGKKILIANVPTDGHFNPLTGLAKHLQELGCDLRWYTSKIFMEKLRKLGIPHHPFIRAKEYNGQSLAVEVPEIKTATGPEKGKLYLKHLFIDRGTEYFEDIQAIYDWFPFELCIADSMFSGMPFIRYKMGIPVMAIGVVPLLEDSVDTAPAGRALPPVRSKENHIAYAEMYKQKYKNISKLIARYKADLQLQGITVNGSFIFDTLVKEANIYLQIGVPSFEYTRTDLSKNIRYIGALLPYAANQNNSKWFDPRLEKYDNIVLVTQGTMEADTNKILSPSLQAFTGTETLVIATTGGPGTAELRKQFCADNIIIEDFIPFDDIMPYISVYITNGGYGGTLLSIMNGIPVVAAGLHELKNEVCARINYFGLGIDLKTEYPTPEAIFDAAQQVMSNAGYKNRVQALRDEIRKYNSLDLCTMYAESLLNTVKQ